MSVAFIDCPPEQIPPLRAFFSEMYWPDYILSQDETFLRWQFGPTPSSQSDNYHVILAMVNDQIKGCIGYIPTDVSLGGRRRRAAWAANWMVDESTRRLGLGPLLMRELSKRFDVTLALGGNRDAHDLLPRMGWTDFGMLARYVCVLDMEKAAQLADGGALEWPLAAGAGRRVGGGLVTQVDSFTGEATTLWDKRIGATSAGTRRTAAFLNWRYAEHPNFTHRLFELRCGGRLEGVAVSRLEQVRDMPVRVTRILEILSDEEHAPALLTAVLDDARADGAAIADFFCRSRRLDGPLRAAGLIDGDAAGQIPILFQPLDRGRTGVLFMAHLQKAPEAAAVTDWYVTKSDGDQDRPS